MRIVFVGAVAFSRHCLEQTLRAGGDVVAVFTADDRAARAHADACDLLGLARAHRIPAYRVRRINAPEVVKQVRAWRPDVIFVFGWSQLIGPRLLAIPPLGCIGSHPALLPRNRGRHPLIWALVEGLTESGLTFFYLDEHADSGDILWQRSFPIDIQDDAADLYGKITVLASEAIGEFLPQLASGKAPRRPQDQSQASYWRKRGEADGEVDWSAPTMQTYNLIRALARPYVGAHTWHGDLRIRLWRAALPKHPLQPEAESFEPGTVITSSAGGLTVRTGDGHLRILEFAAQGAEGLRRGTRLGVMSCAS